MAKRRRILEVSGKAILTLIGILGALVLAEFIARLLGPPYHEGRLRNCDRMLGWRGKPNVSTMVSTEECSAQVVWNSQGMHDREHDVEKEDGVFRVMVLGDSYVEATQVEETQTSHCLLEDMLNSRAPANIRFEVISVGIGGWGPNQELLYFRSEGQAYAPDLVLVMWHPGNDLADILPDHRETHEGYNCYAPYFAICDGRFDPEPWFSAPGIPPTWKKCSGSKKVLTNALNRLYFNSRLYQRLEPFITQGYDRIMFDPWWAPWISSSGVDEVLSYAYQLNAEIYFQLADEAAQAGAKTAFVVAPFKFAVRSEVDPVYREQLETTTPGLRGVNPAQPNQVLAEMMEAKGLPVLDLQPHFVAHLKEGGELLFFETDWHWTVAGNRLVAEVVADWLVEQGMVPASALSRIN